MKILWLNWRDIKNPQAGGAEIMTHETAKRLVKNGNSVTLFTASFPGSLREETVDGVRIIRKGNLISCRLWAFIWYLRKSNGIVDLVIDEINTIPFFTNFYVKERKVALIHQLAREYWWTETIFPLNIVGFLLEPLYLRLYRNIPTIAASKSTKEDLENLGFKRVSVFHQGLSVTPLKHLPKKPKSPHILFIGRLTKTKGFQNALLSFSQIHKKYPTASFTMCVRGSNEALNNLRELINSLHLSKSVSVIENVSLSKKKSLLKKAHLVLVPSLREGWCLVAIEACAFGAVPVGYNVQGLRDSIQHNKTGILCTRNDPYSMAKSSILILSNQKLYQKISFQALLWAKKFNWDETFRSISPILTPAKKSILIFNWRDIKNPQAGGAEKVTHYLSTCLVKKGVRVTIISSQFKGSTNEETIDGVKIIRKGNFLTVYFHAFSLYKKYFEGEVDLVIDQIHGIPFLTPFYVKEHIIAFIYEIAGPIWFYEVPFPFSLFGYIFEKIYFLFYRKVPFIAISNSTKDDLIRSGIKRNHIYLLEPYILDGLPKTLPQKSKSPSIIYLGRLSPVKRIGDTIKAFSIVNKIYPKSRLFIVGKGKKDYMNKLINLTAKLNLINRVNFVGYVGEREKWKLIASSWILTMTSVKEGYGMAVLEGQAVGTPAVVYKVSGLSDAIKHTISGLFSKYETPNALSEQILFLLNNPPYLIALSKKAKNTIVKIDIREKFIKILKREGVDI